VTPVSHSAIILMALLSVCSADFELRLDASSSSAPSRCGDPMPHRGMDAHGVDPRIEAMGPSDPEERFHIDPAEHPDGAPVAFANLLQFCDALDRRELVAALDALPIAESERAALLEAAAREFPEFVERCNAIRNSYGAGYMAACAALADRMTDMTNTAAIGRERAKELARVERIRSVLAHEMERAELDLLGRMIDGAAEVLDIQALNAQVPIGEASVGGAEATRRRFASMTEGISLRAQVRWNREGIPRVRGADIDLRRELEDLIMPIQERAAIEPHLIELERMLTTRQRERCRAYWAALPRVNRWLADAGAGERSTADAESAAQRAFGVQVGIAREMRRAIEHCMDAIASERGSVCTPDCASEIRARFRRAVFPEFYPDEKAGEVDRAYARRLERLDPASDAAKSAAQERASWRAAYEATCRAIEREFLAWTDLEAALKTGYDIEERAALVESLLKRRGMFEQMPID